MVLGIGGGPCEVNKTPSVLAAAVLQHGRPTPHELFLSIGPCPDFLERPCALHVATGNLEGKPSIAHFLSSDIPPKRCCAKCKQCLFWLCDAAFQRLTLYRPENPGMPALSALSRSGRLRPSRTPRPPSSCEAPPAARLYDTLRQP
jgi:hypothetical protein